MRFLLTGATGFLGNNLLRALVQRGDEVICLVRSKPDQQSLAGLKFQAVYADLSRPETLNQQIPDFDVLLHSAAMIQLGWTLLAESRAVNVQATDALAQLCLERQARMVHVSTVDTLGYSPDGRPMTESDREPAKPACSYVVSKREAEEALARRGPQGLDAVVIHPGFMVGPWDWKPSSGKMLLSVASGMARVAPKGGCSAVDVRDVAAGVLAAAEKGKAGEHYILGGENVSYFELWTRMARVAGKRPPRFVLPDAAARAAGRFGDAWGWVRGREPIVNSANTAMGQLKNYYSSERAQRELGYRFGPLDRGLEDSWTWFREHGLA